MQDSATVVTKVTQKTPAMPGVQRRQVQVGLRLTRKLTRAHLLLATRGALAQEGLGVASTVAAELSRQLGAPFAVEGHLVEGLVSPAVSASDRAVFGIVELTAVGGHALVELDAPLVALLLERATGSTEAITCLTRLTRIEEAALGWLFLAALSAVRCVPGFDARFRPRLVTVLQDRREALSYLEGGRAHVAVDLAFKQGERCGSARVAVPSLTLQAALEAVAADVPGDLAPEVLAASTPVTCLVGPAQLDRQTAGALAAGDVVLFRGVQPLEAAVAGPARLVSPAFELSGELVAGGFAVHRAGPRAPSREFTMSDQDATVPVEVEIELARLRLTIAELASIRAGGLLPLHINAASLVTLRIGDKAVAKAELVDIEGEIGARIVSML